MKCHGNSSAVVLDDSLILLMKEVDAGCLKMLKNLMGKPYDPVLDQSLQSCEPYFIHCIFWPQVVMRSSPRRFWNWTLL